MPLFRRVCLLLFAASFALSLHQPECAGQETPGAEIVDARIGLGGLYKLGSWTPVQVTVSTSTRFRGQLVLSAADGDGTPVAFSDEVVLQLEAGETARVVRYVKFGRPNGGLTVQLRDEAAIAAQRTWEAGTTSQSLSSDAEWVVVLGPDFGVRAALDNAHVTAIETADEVPDKWYGYEGVDAVALATSDPQWLASLTDVQQAALRQWITLGGRLILCAGGNGEEMLGPSGPLASLAPGEFVRVQTFRSIPSLETYVRSSQALDTIDGRRRRPELRVSLLENTRGRMEAYETSPDGRRPIVVRAPHGLGQVVFVAVDLDQPPFSDWEGHGRLIEKLIRGDVQKKERVSGRQSTGQLVHLGYSDLTGQLRNALDQFTSVKLVAFSWIAGLIALYVLLIGPLDYFFLKNVVRRMQGTWVTFTAMAVAFSIIAVVLHGQFKEHRVQVNQVDLIDIDSESGLVRGTSWMHVYNPETAAHNVALQPKWWPEAEGGNLATWQGLPGTGLGGLRRQLSSIFDPPLAHMPYAIEINNDRSALVNLPIPADGTQVLTSRSWQVRTFEATELRTTPDGLLRGDVSNPLPCSLSDCMVVYDNWAYRLERKGGVLRPGDSAKVDLEKAINLSWRLTRRRVVEIRDVTTPWNPQDLDVARIVEMMMFFKAAGGENYTGLKHRYQPYIDLSEHLRLGRAILVGRASAPATTLLLDNEPVDADYERRTTFCRVVFPVDRSAMIRKR